MASAPWSEKIWRAQLTGGITALQFDPPSDYSIVGKFGANAAVGTTAVPICIGGIYQMPQPAAAATLRVRAGNAADISTGAGAREITIQGLDATGALQTASVATAGDSNSGNFSGTWIRVFRAFVSSSGSYWANGTDSQAGDIIVETTGGTAWLTINSETSVFGRAQSQIGAYSVPLGYEAVVGDIRATIDGAQSGIVYIFVRNNILQTAVPYSAGQLKHETNAITGQVVLKGDSFGVIPELSDIVVFGRSTQGTTQATVSFDIHLRSV